MPTNNVLLKTWIGPYGGVPPWDMVEPEDFLPAFEAAIKQSAADIDTIANQSAAPTFENTIIALEESSQDRKSVV